MAMADDEPDDLSVRLEWPVDPLADAPADAGDSDPLVRLENRLSLLEARDLSDYVTEELIDTLRDMSDSFRLALDDVADAVRQLNDTVTNALQENTAALDEKVSGLRTAMMAMLASRQAEEQRTQRRDRETLVAKLEEDMNAISRALLEAMAAARTQSDVFADRVAAELQALRRRIPVKGQGNGVDDNAIEEIVNRVVDEVEIRVVELVKPRPPRKRG